jgi:hypothetical protein
VPAAAAATPGNGSNGANGHGTAGSPQTLTPQTTQEVAVVMEYLRTVHEIISTGSDIVRRRISEGAQPQ